MSFWSGKNVFVTGATGLVGSWLTKKLLSLGAEVTCLIQDSEPHSELYRSEANKRIHVVNGSLENISDIERGILRSEADTVFHLGAQTLVGFAYHAPLATFEANVRGTYQLLEVCRRNESRIKRVVFASSDKAYGDSDKLPYHEHYALQGKFPYDVSKSCSDLICQSYFHTYNLPVAIARCGNIFGGGDLNWSRIVPGTIRSLEKGERPIVRSDGTLKRDYIYVEDVVQAYLCLAEKLEKPQVRGQAYNFGPEKPMSVLEMVELVAKLMNRSDLKPDIKSQNKAEIIEQSLNSDRAKTDLGWSIQTDLQEAMKKTIAWYQTYLKEHKL